VSLKDAPVDAKSRKFLTIETRTEIYFRFQISDILFPNCMFSSFLLTILEAECCAQFCEEKGGLRFSSLPNSLIAETGDGLALWFTL
jgi:hypothetical protein